MSPLIDRPTAQVSGYPAKVIGELLRAAVRGQVGVFGRLPDTHRAEVLDAAEAIWQAGEREADDDIRNRRGVVYGSADEFLASL